MAVLRDVALIVLALQGALCALIPVAVLAAVHYGLYRSRWWQRVPRLLARADALLLLLRERVEGGARSVSAPLFRLSEGVAAARAMLGLRRQRPTSDRLRG